MLKEIETLHTSMQLLTREGGKKISQSLEGPNGLVDNTKDMLGLAVNFLQNLVQREIKLRG